jgi:hypothetical protein
MLSFDPYIAYYLFDTLNHVIVMYSANHSETVEGGGGTVVSYMVFQENTVILNDTILLK